MRPRLQRLRRVRLPRLDLADVQVLGGLVLLVAGLWLLFGVPGVAALMTLGGAYLIVNGASRAR